MKLLLLMLMLAVAAVKAGPPVPQNIETVYTDGKEYIYKYESQVISGLPLGSKIYSGLKVKGVIRLQKISLLEMKMEMKEPRLFKVIGTIERRDPTKELLPDSDMVELVDEDSDIMKSQLFKPVKFSYMHGHVEDLVTEGDDPDWSVSIKKGALSLLEINFNDRHSLSPDVHMNGMEFIPKLYRVVEASVSGECETTYRLKTEMSRDGVPSMEIVKVRDLNKCIDQLVYTRSMTNDQPCDKISEILSAQSSVRYSLLGAPDQYIIVSAVGESQYDVVPHTEKQGRLSTLANQTLTLIDYRPITDQILDPKSPSMPDHPLMVKTPEQRQRPSTLSVKRQEQVEMVRKALAGIDPLMKDKVEEDVMVLIKDLYGLLGKLDKTDLETIIKEVDKDPSKPRARLVLLDMLPAVGTHATVDLMLDRLETKPESPEVTAIRLMTLGLLPEPDIPIMKRVMDYVEKVNKQDLLVKRAAWLCLGALGHKLMKRNHTEITDLKKQENIMKLLREESNDRELRRKLDEKLDQLKDDLEQKEKLHSAAKEDIIKMVEKLYQLADEDSKLLALKTIGNLAFTDFLKTLGTVVKDKDSPLLHRMVALISMKNQAKYQPEEVQKSLLPVFFDRMEEEEVRSLAVLVAFMTGLPKPELEMVAKSMTDEPSGHVRALVSSVLTELSNATSPCKCYKSLIHNSTLALRFAGKPEPGIHNSNMVYKTMFDKELQMGQIYEQVMLYSSKEKLPRAVAIAISSFSEGRSVKVLEVGYMAKGLDGVLDRILKDPNLGGMPELVRKVLHPRHTRSASDTEQDIQDIKEKLEVKPRKPEPLKGIFHLSLYGQELIYFDIDKMLPQMEKPKDKPVSLLQSLEARVSSVLPDVTGMLDVLKQLMDRQGSVVLPLYQASLPTETGLPLKLDSKMIGAFKLDGDIQIKMDPKMSKKKSLLSKFDSVVNMRISGVGESVMDMMVELKTIHSAVSVRGKVGVDIPAVFSINMDPDKDKVLVRITDQKKLEPIKIEMKPVVMIKKLPERAVDYPKPSEEREINVMYGAEVETIDNEYGEIYMGRKLAIVGMRAVRKDDGKALPSISGKQSLHVRYDPMSHKDMVIQFQHVRVMPGDPAMEVSPAKKSWWPFKWLMAPSDTAPPEYDVKDSELEIPVPPPMKGFINLEEENLSIPYLKSKFSEDTEMLKSGDKCGVVIRVSDPDLHPKHELQLSTLYQRDESSFQHLYAVELRRKPVQDETKDWKMVTSITVDLPVTEVEPSDLEDNEYQHEVEKQIQEMTEEPSNDVELKSRLLLKVLTELDEPEPKSSNDILLENVISYVLDKEVVDSIEDLKVLVQKQRNILKTLEKLDKQEINPKKKKQCIESLKTEVKKLQSITSEVTEKLDKVVSGKQKPEEAVVVLYILSSQKVAEKKLKDMMEKLQSFLSLDEKIDMEKSLVELMKEHDKLREKQEKHSLDKQPTEKDKAMLEINPGDRIIYRDLMSLEKNLISIKIKPKLKLANQIEEKKFILEVHTKLESTLKDVKKIIDQLDRKLFKQVDIGKMLHMKIVEILLHQHLVVLDLSDSKFIEKLSLHGRASPHSLSDPKDNIKKVLLHKQKEEMILYSRKILTRQVIAVDAIKDLRSLASLMTPQEQRDLKSLQKLKLKQLLVLEHLQEISYPKKDQPPPQQTLQDTIQKIKDISTDVYDIVDPIITDYKKPVLSPVVVRGLKVLARQLPITDKALKLVKENLLLKATTKNSNMEKDLERKFEVKQLKLDVVREIEKIEKLHLEDVSNPDLKETVSVPVLLTKSLKLEAKRLRLQPAVEEIFEEMDKPFAKQPTVEETVKKQKLLYDALSQAIDIQDAIELLSKKIHDKLSDLTKDGSVLDLLKMLERKQKDHLKLVKRVEDKLKQNADLDHSFYQPLQDIQKLKDKAQRHELKIEDIKKDYKKIVGEPVTGKALLDEPPLPARSLLPLTSLHKPLKAMVVITSGPMDGQQKRMEILLLGRKSIEQLFWEKDQSLPDKQDKFVSTYLQDKLVKDDRAAIGYKQIKEELNTYRHLHVLCTYEDSLPVSVRLFSWKIHELVKLLYYNKVTLILPNKTNVPNKLDIRLDIKQDSRMLDLEIKTPYETNLLRHLDVPSVCKLAALPKSRPVKEHLIYTLMGTSSEATCEVSKDRIKTLLGTRYELDTEVESCERVLTLDCGYSDKLVITSKPVKASPDKKILKIITQEHKIEMIPRKSDIMIKVDEAKKDLKEPVIVKGKLSVYKLPDGSVEVKIPDIGVSVVTDGMRSSIKVNKLLGPKLCGLCGELTAGVGSDMRDPLQVAIPRPQPFVSTYLLPDPGVCNAKALQKKHKVLEIRKMAKLALPVEITKVLLLDKEGKTCFSRTPVRSCPNKTKPEGIKSFLVSFYCLRSTHPKVQVYKEHAKNQIIGELRFKRISVNEYVSEPSYCETE